MQRNVYIVANSDGKPRFIVFADSFNRAKELASERGKKGEIFDRAWYLYTTLDVANEGERIYKEI